MNLFIKDPKWGRGAFDNAVKVMFGLQPKDKWPEQGMARRTVQGIHVWVEPIRLNADGRVKFSIRAMAQCPACHRTMPIGRLQQHSKIHR